MRTVVVLPEPLGPISPRIVPAWTSNESPTNDGSPIEGARHVARDDDRFGSGVAVTPGPIASHMPALPSKRLSAAWGAARGWSWCWLGTRYAIATRTSSKETPLMSDLSTKERDALRKDQFAYVDSEGEEHLPIHDESHVRNAISRFNQTDFESKAAKERARKKILAAAERHGIEVDEDSNVREPAD